MFSAGSGISKQYAPIAVKAGAVVVDNSSAFRIDPAVPLVMPEINARRIKDHKGIIANPNCSAITALVPLWPMHQVNPHQAADRLHLSGGVGRRRGGDGRTGAVHPRLSGRQGLSRPRWCKYPYAFNLFSHNTAIDMATGYNDEESKVIKETKKIFEDDKIACQRHLHPRAGAARPFGLHDLRVRAADHAGRGARRCWPRRRA